MPGKVNRSGLVGQILHRGRIRGGSQNMGEARKNRIRENLTTLSWFRDEADLNLDRSKPEAVRKLDGAKALWRKIFENDQY